jgi:lysophospholipase L1-like esterase
MKVQRVILQFLAATLLILGLTARGDDVEAPSIQPNAQGLLIATSATPGAIIRYNLDGRPPTKDDGVWLAPVDQPAGYPLAARAFLPGTTNHSAVVTSTALGPGSAPRKPSTLVPVTQNRDWRVYDWAERHAACVALMKERQPEIVMLGDSITHFWGGDPVGGRRNGTNEWDRLFAGHSVVNLGYGWDRTENVLWRLTHGEFDNASPKVVVVMIGTNNMGLNTPEEIAAGIQAICEEIHRRLPKTHILLLGIFPRGPKPDATRAKVGQVNELIAKFDGHTGVTYLDIGAKFLEPDGSITREMMGDYLHPTAKGYQVWADAMEPTLQRLLKE